LFRDGGSPAEYGAGMELAIERGWLEMHRSGTYVTLTPTGAGCSPDGRQWLAVQVGGNFHLES